MAEETKERSPVTVEARLSAVQENPDGTATVTLATDRMSASVKTVVSVPGAGKNEFWTNIGHVPVGAWPLRITMSAEEAETLAGRVKVAKEVIAQIQDMHMIFSLAISERKGNDFYKEAAKGYDH